MILCIETATGVCSVALCDREKVLGLREAPEGASHASQLTVLAGELLSEHDVSTGSLSAVAVSKGPGSYTGLRIGVSVAKGIAYASGIPLIGVNTLQAMCTGFISEHHAAIGSDDLLCPMLDARRMEVYNAVFNARGEMISDTRAEIITEKSFAGELVKNTIWFFGTGADKCAATIISENAIFTSNFRMSASFLLSPSAKALAEKRFEDVAYFEPYYLKEFLATKPKTLLP